jgi:hypothetical protein
VPHLDLKTWNAPEVADTDGDHDVPGRDGLRAKPEIVGANDLADGSQFRPQAGVRSRRSQIDIQQRETRQHGFYPGFAACSTSGGRRSMNAVQEFAGSDHRAQNPGVFPTSHEAIQIEITAFELEEDRGVN